ncbi:Synaptonemal complex protein zep1 [Thalictrum thalictroides]|uniref:Synaptonemal complex protein zep1 n=1 Tax=Thalictrum thalictroides TaxID=46969 RepID=A0A7J6WLI7_THATH|nr:Synaptonemal complex protein zep1 [Thalictrum thalictroides]
MLRISKLESEKQDIQDQLEVKIQGTSEVIEVFQKVIVRHEELVDSLEKQASQLRDTLMEIEPHIQFTDREKLLEDQRTEILVSLAVAENTLSEVKKQYDLMLESKPLKEISQKNDQLNQATNDIRRKLELEKLEIINPEKEKNRRNIVGFPTQMMILLMTCFFFIPVVSALDTIFEVSGLVTLEGIEIFTTHEWFKSTPIVYFRCQGENKTVLFDVKKKNVIYAFKGDESWQPLTKFTDKKCKRCGFYEEDTIGLDDVFDEWEFCPSEFKPPRGRYILFKGNELNATFLCPQCKGTSHSSEVPVGSPRSSEVPVGSPRSSEVPQEKKLNGTL